MWRERERERGDGVRLDEDDPLYKTRQAPLLAQECDAGRQGVHNVHSQVNSWLQLYVSFPTLCVFYRTTPQNIFNLKLFSRTKLNTLSGSGIRKENPNLESQQLLSLIIFFPKSKKARCAPQAPSINSPKNQSHVVHLSQSSTSITNQGSCRHPPSAPVSRHSSSALSPRIWRPLSSGLSRHWRSSSSCSSPARVTPSPRASRPSRRRSPTFSRP